MTSCHRSGTPLLDPEARFCRGCGMRLDSVDHAANQTPFGRSDRDGERTIENDHCVAASLWRGP